MIIFGKDRQVIRDLAKKQLEIAQSDSMQQLKKDWLRHNSCKEGRPLVTIEWATFRNEIITPLLKTKGPLARMVESMILSNFVGHELFDDDSVVNDYLSFGKNSWFRPFGIKPHVDRLKDSVGYHHQEILKDLGEDIDLLRPSQFGLYRFGSAFLKNTIGSLVGDIIPVKHCGHSMTAVPTQDIVHIMSLENIMFSMYDYPDEFHKMMTMLSDDYVAYFKHIESNNFLLPTTSSEWVGQGSYAFTDELPSSGKITLNDVWGFMDSQETSGISPDMFEEFIFPYYKKISDNFGMLSYGCCEAVDPIWDNCISKLTNLRKVSISPWCNEEFMGERLAGSKIVYHRKPSPNFIGVNETLDEDAVRQHIRKTINATKGCTVEFTQRDVYTVHNNMQKVRDYVRIIREESTR